MLKSKYPGGVLLPTFTIVNTDGTIDPAANKTLNDKLIALSGLQSGQRMATANLRESIFRIFIGDNLFDGFVINNGDPLPMGTFEGQLLLIGAKYAEQPAVDIIEDIKIWDGSTWVTPTPKLFAKGLINVSGMAPSGCSLKLDALIPAVKHYNDGKKEGWLKGEWVEKDGIYSLSVVGEENDENFTNPDISDSSKRAKYWKYSYTPDQLCEAINDSVGKLLLSIFDLLGSDVVSEVSFSDVIKALAANNDEALAALLDTKFLTPKNLEALKATLAQAKDASNNEQFLTPGVAQELIRYITAEGVKTWAAGDSGANGNGVVLGSDGKWYLANPNGQPATNDPTVEGNRPAHWQGPYSSLGDLIAALAGAGSTPNGWVIVDANCATGMIKLKRPDGTTCTLFTKELEGVSITAPTSAPARTTGLAASVTTPTNGTAPYTYHWTLPDGSTENTKDVTFIAPATVGTYTIKCDVTDANGMTTSKSQSITVEVLLPVILFDGNSGSSGTVTLSQNAKNFVRLYSEATPTHGNDWVRVWHVVAGPSVQNQGPCRTTTLSADGLTFTHEITSCDGGNHGDNYLNKVTGYYD